MFFGLDSTWFVLVLPVVILSMFLSSNVKSTFAKYQKVPNQRRLKGYEVAREILDRNGLYHVKVQPTRGTLSDHYDPRSETVFLSEPVYSSFSVAALGVAAHEVGHAVQHAEGYKALSIRNAILPVAQIGSQATWLLVILGLVTGAMQLFDIGIILFLAVIAFQLVTLPVEFNASSRAITQLNDYGYLTATELPGAKKVLNAAALTYVAAVAVSLANLARLLILRGSRD